MNPSLLEFAYRQCATALVSRAALGPSSDREQLLHRAGTLQDAADALLLAQSTLRKSFSDVSIADAIEADFNARADALARSAA